jgi:hypothetical protein
MRPTLEEERRALLEQFEASRAVYRRMLSGTHTARITSSLRQTGSALHIAPDFPRSHTMSWIIAHRWQLALGAAAFILIRPDRRLFNRNAVKKGRPMPRSSAVKALAAASASLLQNRSNLHLAGRVAAMLLRWMQQRRA